MTTAKTDTKPVSIAAKLAAIYAKTKHIPKNGFNKAQNYPFVRETDVAEAISDLLAEANIFILQSATRGERIDLYRTNSGNMMTMSTVDMSFTFVDGDTGETLGPVTFPGDGADTGDKGIYKALTGAEKYFLMKTFLVSTGDDPEADEKVDTTAAASGAARGRKTTVTKANNGTVGKGGRSDKSTDAQLTELKRLAKEYGVTSQTGMVDLIHKVMTDAGVEVPEWNDSEALGAYLRSLSSKDMGALIISVAALVDAKNEPQEESDDDDTLDLE